jgi:hypothetical protein
VGPNAYIDTLDFLAPGAMATAPFVMVAGLLLGALPVWAVVWMLAKARGMTVQGALVAGRLAKRASWPLSAGPGRVVRGKVEPLGAEELAASVTVVQEARNITSKQARSHEWREVSRESVAVPFALVRDDGQRVRVEPGKDLLLVDALVTEAPDPTSKQRVRRAEATRGEMFCAYGELHKHAGPEGGAYRANAEPWVLRPPRGTGRVLLTSAPLDDRFVERAKVLRQGAILVGLVVALFHAVVTVPLVAEVRRAEHAYAAYDKTICPRDPRARTQCVVSVAVKPGVLRAGTAPYRAAKALEASQLLGPQRLQVPVLIDRRTGQLSALGHDVGANPWLLALGALVLLAAFGWIRFAYLRALPWYDRRRLVEPGGAGHWPRETPVNVG